MIISMSHGSGGVESAALVRDVFWKHFANGAGSAEEDAAVLPLSGRTAFTADSFVVRPLVFPGGDIGRLAVCGTVNDLLTAGARPRFLSAAFILGEGLEVSLLEYIAASMRAAADEAGVCIVTGDTKVVEGAPELYISTAGVGEVDRPVSFRSAEEGDMLLVTGTLGDHHACILSARMGVQNNIFSDAAPLCDIARALQDSGVELRGLRDITRGGLATVLNEIAALTGLKAEIRESDLPVRDEVAGLCDILGLDPLTMANEGKLLVAVPERDLERALAVIRAARYGENAAVIGQFSKAIGARVEMLTRLGGRRVVPPLAGEALPRIC